MRIPKMVAFPIGVLTIWPLIYMFVFIGSFFFIFSNVRGGNVAQDRDPFEWLFIAHLGTMLLMFALLAFYIVHVFKNTAFRDDRRILWAVVLLMGGPVAMPIYWWLHVWSETSIDGQGAAGGSAA